MSKYEKEFKEEAIRLCKAKDSNKAEIARKLGVEYKTLSTGFTLQKTIYQPKKKLK